MSCALRCVAWTVFIFNIILGCLGVAILTVGILLQLNVINYILPITDVKESLDYLPIVIIAVGGLIVIVGFLGCGSALKGNIKLLWTYVIVLVIIFAIQVCVGIYVMFQVHCQNEVQNRINSQLLDMIANYYGDNTAISTRMDSLQRNFECCGVESSADWNNVLPQSCCEIAGNEACSPEHKDMFKHGCGPLILDHFNTVVKITYILAFAVAAQQFVGVMFAFILMTTIRNEKRRKNYQKY